MDGNITLIAPPGPASGPRAHWPQHLQAEFDRDQFNGAVGSKLVSETDRVRVWHLSLAPGGWLPFHRHVLDYFWSALSAGVARGYYDDGRIVDVRHHPGETRHYRHGAGEHFVHGIENVGDTELNFVTVEFLIGDNQPLPVPDSVRLQTAPLSLAAHQKD